MAHRVGLCTNVIYCSFASARQDVQVPADSKFVCPQCGKPLADAPAAAADSRSRMAVIAGGGLALTGGALFVVGALFGHGSAPATATERAAAADSSARPRMASLAVAPRPTPQAPAPAVTQAVFTPSPAAPSQPAAMRVAMIQPAPGPMPAENRPAAQPAAPPPALSEDAQARLLKATALHSLQVLEQERADLLAKQAADTKVAKQAQAAKQAAKQAQAAKEAQAAKLAQAARAAQAAKDAKEAQAARDAQATREAEEEQAAQQAKAAQEAQAEQVARAAQEALAAQKARAAQAAAAAPKPAAQVQVAAITPPKPPKPAGPDRAFTAAPLSGGAPTYPDVYESEGRSGQVAVSCRIDTTGHPSSCHVLGAKGGNAFGTAVLSWLGSGRVRYAPVLHAGVPVAETHEWTMNFQP